MTSILPLTAPSALIRNLGRTCAFPSLNWKASTHFAPGILIGINDGEWNTAQDSGEVVKHQSWYSSILSDVGFAAGVDDFNRETLLLGVVDKGKEQLRLDSRLR